MNELSHIQARDPIRAELAEAMAEFERINGAVETLPIRRGIAPPQGFVINVPGKPKAEAKPRRITGPRKERPNIVIKRQKIAVVRELLAQGLSYEDVAERADFNPKLKVKYIQRICHEHGLRRGTPAGRIA